MKINGIRKISKAFGVLFVMTLISCYPFFKGQKQPTNREFILNTKNFTLTYTGPEKGITRLVINLVADTNGFHSGYVSNYLDETFQTPLRRVDLSQKDTLFLKSNRLMLQFWTDNPQSESYSWIEINSKNWIERKSIYSKYNSRH